MLENLISIIAIFLGLIAILMVWLAGQQRKTMVSQLDGANERVSTLKRNFEAEQQKAEQAINSLRVSVSELKGEPIAPASPPAAGPPPLNEISAQELQARIDRGNELVIVDMRQAFEYNSGHIPKAIHMFVQEIPMRAQELPKDKDIVFQCWHGNTSLQASAYLIENGWAADRVSSLSGGMAGWVQTHGTESLVKDS